ncbi:DUF4123 domain-containing protein [Rhodovulum sp. DZ06]|uniref:DUF4123 domain-containing protein n=1 Tax=Rhodovulum sp. DZ06 TaxID=3425126 RepID=UPI003D3369C8
MTDKPDLGPIKSELESALFGDRFLNAYAVIDGARCLELMPVLDAQAPPHECLFMGELAPEMEMVAPHLVQLDRDKPLFHWLFENGWGDSWAIFLTSERRILDLRSHFRRLTVVEMPDGQFVYFRFYDPRVLRSFLPTCDAEQTAQMFGEPVDTYFVESDAGAEILRYRRTG